MRKLHKMNETEINIVDSALKSAIKKKNEEGGAIKLSDLDALFNDDSQKDQTTI